MFGDYTKAEKIYIACGYTDMRKAVFCKYFLEKVASCFSIVLQLHFPQCCKLSFPAKGERESLQAYVAEVD
jgi:hypothetical protein